MKFRFICLVIALLPMMVGCNRHNGTAGGGVTTGWVSYTPSDKSFSIMYPETPKEETKSVTTQIGPIIARAATYSTNSGNRAYVASAVRYNVDPNHYDVEKALDEARDGAVQNVQGTLISDSKVQLNGISGRQFIMKTSTGYKAKVRLYIAKRSVGPTMFQALVIDKSGDIDNLETTAFLESLIPDKN